jgi:hypothetical protein
VHGGHAVGLAHDEQRPAGEPGAQVALELGQRQRLGVAGALLAGQDPQPGAGLHPHRRVGARAGDLVRAVAEEDEVPLPQPAEELQHLAVVARVVGEAADVAGHRALHPLQLVDHRAEVAGGLDHVGEAALHLGADGGGALAPGHVRDLDVPQRLQALPAGVGAQGGDGAVGPAVHPQHRVDVVEDGDVLGVQVLAQRVDDEGPVAHLGADHGDGGGPPLVARVRHLHVHPVGARALEELPGAQDHGAQLGHRALLQQRAGDAGEEGARELAGERLVVALQGADMAAELVGGGHSAVLRVRAGVGGKRAANVAYAPSFGTPGFS